MDSHHYSFNLVIREILLNHLDDLERLLKKYPIEFEYEGYRKVFSNYEEVLNTIKEMEYNGVPRAGAYR